MTPGVTVWRGDQLESVHAVHAAVVNADGALLASVGDPGLLTFLRSAIKPFQALPLVEDGVADALGLTDAELAVACASHGAEPDHLAAVRGILDKAGASEDQLECGPHPPLRVGPAAGSDTGVAHPTAIHNNCSGKHAGMLALAAHHGWPCAGYRLAGHPVQDRVMAVVSEWFGTPPEDIPRGVDGCGVVTFALALESAAAGFARFAAASRDEGSGPGRVVGAMMSQPWMVAGSGRLCTELMTRTAGRMFAKTGAEGVYAAGVPSQGLGIALKVEDGAQRAAGPALLRILEELGVLSEDEVGGLADHAYPRILNTRGEEVGRIQAGFPLREAVAG